MTFFSKDTTINIFSNIIFASTLLLVHVLKVGLKFRRSAYLIRSTQAGTCSRSEASADVAVDICHNSVVY